MLRLQATELCFLFGLVLYAIGQFLIFVYFTDLDSLHSQKPIDYAHWCMLLGVLMLVPKIGELPKSGYRLIGSPLLILGIGLTVGMCALDFVFWALDSKELKTQVVSVLKNTPSIWLPFISYSGIIFILGLTLSSMSYWPHSRTSVVLVCAGAVTMYLGGGWLNPAGYIVITAGFSLGFVRSRVY